jgi:hypothetical protein
MQQSRLAIALLGAVLSFSEVGANGQGADTGGACAPGVHLHIPPTVEAVVHETSEMLEQELEERAGPNGELDERALAAAAKSAVAKVSKKHGWGKNPWVRRIGASGLVVLCGGTSFGVAHVIAQAVPGNLGGAVYGVWAFLNLELMREASSIETELLSGNVRRWFWGIRNGVQAMTMNMPALLFQRRRYENSNAAMNSLEHEGRSITNNADLASALRWLAAHRALVDYLENPTDLRLESLARIFASAVPPIWLTYSSDFLTEDPVLISGARQMLADFAKENGRDLRALLTEKVLKILKPNAHQEVFFREFVRACLTPTSE